MVETFLDSLGSHIADDLCSEGVLRSYPARSFVFHEGDPSNGVYIVESGLLRIDQSTARGRVALLDLAVEGMLIGDLGIIDGNPRSATLATVQPATIRHLQADRFLELVDKHKELQVALLQRLARRIRALSTQFLETSTMDAPARVAARLLHLLEIVRKLEGRDVEDTEPIEIRLPINQEELGQWAGLTREGTVVGLRTLRSIHLIETARMLVTILDLEGLRKIARNS